MQLQTPLVAFVAGFLRSIPAAPHTCPGVAGGGVEEAQLDQASALSPSSMQCNRSSSRQGKEANQELPRKKALPDVDLDR